MTTVVKIRKPLTARRSSATISDATFIAKHWGITHDEVPRRVGPVSARTSREEASGRTLNGRIKCDPPHEWMKNERFGKIMLYAKEQDE